MVFLIELAVLFDVDSLSWPLRVFVLYEAGHCIFYSFPPPSRILRLIPTSAYVFYLHLPGYTSMLLCFFSFSLS